MLKKRILILVFIFCGTLSAQQAVRYQLYSIQFEGNNTFSSSTLKDLIYSEETPWWFWRFLHSFTSLGREPSYFDSTNIQIDINSLREYYNTNGFFNSKFSYKYSVDTADRFVDLTYLVNEGPPSDFGSLKLHDLSSVPQHVRSNVDNAFTLDTNQRYSQMVLHNDIQNSINILLNNGFMFAKLDSTIIYKDTLRHKANLDVFISSGKMYGVDTVLVHKTGEGADLVTEKLLRDITGIQAGEVYNLDKLRRSQVRLYRTGLFNTVVLAADEKDTTDSKVPVRLDGNIGLLNELSPEIILNMQQNAFNIGLGAAYIRKNFLGEARKLTISSSFGIQNIVKVDFKNLIKRFSFRDTTLLGYFDSHVTVEQPYLFGKPIFGTWDNYVKINKQAQYNNTLYGSIFTMDFELPSYTFINHLSTSYNIEQSNEVYRTNNDSLSTKLISDISADIASTTADNILFPTQGYNLSFHAEEANSIPYLFDKITGSGDPGALFYKLVLNSSYYFSVDRRKHSIAAFKFKIGHIQTFYGSYSGIPLNRTFYAGGSNSVRGWSSNQLVPQGTDSVKNVQGISVKGGTFLVEGSVEFRRKFLENVGYALFFDYGNSWLGYHQFRWDGVALAAGLGLRYYTAVAPFRVDFGLKFYDPSNHKFIWHNWNPHFMQNIEIHFGIGEAF